ncbi:hypothetical protein JX265_004416 [Neoarthrinium moseri]|uniref:Uncharacterized protein n=1 Tax=Neoarthrinium moseri TaxID=1658444 RepID=A0A9P9WQX7_9PEZI|nr:hypothetical protein JX266_003987 [Neoarthrinium moseri]KAI1875358.1 hypothetical protein JX265_004416 [Neoarthrinium moseri]
MKGATRGYANSSGEGVQGASCGGGVPNVQSGSGSRRAHARSGQLWPARGSKGLGKSTHSGEIRVRWQSGPPKPFRQASAPMAGCGLTRPPPQSAATAPNFSVSVHQAAPFLQALQLLSVSGPLGLPDSTCGAPTGLARCSADGSTTWTDWRGGRGPFHMCPRLVVNASVDVIFPSSPESFTD